MDKVAFFYELGYNMVKEAAENKEDFEHRHPVIERMLGLGGLGALAGAGLGAIQGAGKGEDTASIIRRSLGGALAGALIGGVGLGLPIGTGKAHQMDQMREVPAYMVGGNPLITYLAEEYYKNKLK